MNILFLSRNGDGVSLAKKLKEEGNAVRLFCQSSGSLGEGLVDRVGSWRPSIPWAHLVVADGVGWGLAYEDTLRNFGKPLFGISKLADMLSCDRRRADALLEKLGISVPRRWEGEGAVEEVLREWTSGAVIKSNDYKICKRPEDLKAWAALSGPLQVPLHDVTELLQGVEVRTTGWFNGRGWMEPFYHALMDMEELVGRMGRVGKSMGGVVVRSGGDRLVEQTLMPLTPALKKMGYRGPLSVTAFIESDGLIVLRVFAGLRFDETEAMLEGFGGSLGDLMFETAQGVRTELDITRDVMAVVRLNACGIAPRPIEVNDAAKKHVWLNRVSEWKGEIVSEGSEGILKTTAVGRDVREATKRALRTAEGIGMMNKFYRTDVGQRAQTDLGLLREGGWISA